MSPGEGGPARTPVPGAPRGSRRRLLIIGIALGAAAGLWMFFSDSTPVLDPAALASAKDRWRGRGVMDYTITVLVETDTRRAERIETEVRAGRAVRLVRNGQAVDLRDAYTVEGLFGLIDREIEMAVGKEAGQASGAPRGAKLRASFHETLGVPMVFKRLAPNRLSLVLTVESIEGPGGKPIS